jgi:hypothetical protein
MGPLAVLGESAFAAAWAAPRPHRHPPRRLPVQVIGAVVTYWVPGSRGQVLAASHWATRRLAAVPGLSLNLAVTGERIYLPRADDGALLVLDRQRGRAVGTIPVGRHPLGVTLGSSGA